METQEMQRQVDEWITSFEEGYWKPLAMLARLTEETGELAREVNHLYGEKKKKSTEATAEIAEELADVLFVVVAFANSLDIDLDVAFVKIMKKYRSRDANRWPKRLKSEE